MLDEVALRVNLGCKIAPGHLVAGCFGRNNVPAIVAVSQTLDKLVVHSSSNSALHQQSSDNDNDNEETQPTSHLQPAGQSNQYVVIKDVIKSLSVKYFESAASVNGREVSDIHTTGSLLFRDEDIPKDVNSQRLSTRNEGGLLLVGCSRSLLVYDVAEQTELLDFGYSTSVDTIAHDGGGGGCCLDSSLTVCGGQKRIFALKLERDSDQIVPTCSGEIFCERALDYSVRCIARGQLFGHNLLVCGSLEQRIFIHQLDMFDLVIRAPKLSIKQNAAVNCLCPVITSMAEPAAENKLSGEERQLEELSGELALPPLQEDERQQGAAEAESEQMNYFAYGLENGIIGVYYLFFTGTRPAAPVEVVDGSPPLLHGESLWRQRCKQPPVSMQMYDMNGDGYDELLVGYRNGRLDVRSPFTGQLLATTRCFRQPAERLAGLTVLDYYGNGRPVLIACSTSGHINGYMPRHTKCRLALRAYAGPGLEQARQLCVGAGNVSQMVHTSITSDQAPPDDPNSFTPGSHIESGRGDNVSARKSEAKQNFDYLLRINSLLLERHQLNQRACQLYRKRFTNQLKWPSGQVLAQHRWDFDYVCARLRLTIVVGADGHGYQANFIKLLDESRNFLAAGYLIIDTTETPNDYIDARRSSGATRSQVVVVVPLRPSADSWADSSCELKLSLFYGRPTTGPEGHSQLIQVVTKSIHVPQYPMLVLEPRESPGERARWEPKLRLNCSLIDGTEAQQIVGWLCEKLLCFQFGILMGAKSSSASIDTNLVGVDGDGGFEINLVDAMEILRANNPTQELSVSPGKPLAKASYVGSRLRIAYTKVGGESDAAAAVATCAHLSLECESSSSHSCLGLLRWLVIDRLQSGTDSASGPRVEFVVEMEPILAELSRLEQQAGQLEESEKRLQSELYELAQYTGSLMQQLCISNELNEFTTSRELLNELFIMLNEAQNAARAQTLTCGSRTELVRRRAELRQRVAPFLSG